VVIALFISGPGAITFPVKLFTEVQFNLSPAIMAVSTLLLAAVVLSVVVGIALFGARRTVYRIAKVGSDTTFDADLRLAPATDKSRI
jgi:putative spermidine/putrescine transport system permease protein